MDPLLTPFFFDNPSTAMRNLGMICARWILYLPNYGLITRSVFTEFPFYKHFFLLGCFPFWRNCCVHWLEGLGCWQYYGPLGKSKYGGEKKGAVALPLARGRFSSASSAHCAAIVTFLLTRQMMPTRIVQTA